VCLNAEIFNVKVSGVHSGIAGGRCSCPMQQSASGSKMYIFNKKYIYVHVYIFYFMLSTQFKQIKGISVYDCDFLSIYNFCFEVGIGIA
jgi:hypothetical protein